VSLPLTKRNALILVDELERLIRDTPEDAVTPEAFETATRLLSSLELAPAPPALLQARLASLRAWVEAMLMQAKHASSSPVKAGILVDVSELRSLIASTP
jgi:hypothetical protein